MKTDIGGRISRSAGPLAALPLLLLAGCAQFEMPPGGPEDCFPRSVIETLPDTFSMVEPELR